MHYTQFSKVRPSLPSFLPPDSLFGIMARGRGEEKEEEKLTGDRLYRVKVETRFSPTTLGEKAGDMFVNVASAHSWAETPTDQWAGTSLTSGVQGEKEIAGRA